MRNDIWPINDLSETYDRIMLGNATFLGFPIRLNDSNYISYMDKLIVGRMDSSSNHYYFTANGRLVEEFKGPDECKNLDSALRFILGKSNERLAKEEEDMDEALNKIKKLVNEALRSDGLHHKQYFLFKIAELTEADTFKLDKGVAP
jgi:hypothetical protein